MALITSAWTTATAESITRADALKRILREGFGEYGTATGGSASTIVDTGMLKSSGFPDDKYKGMWARIEYDGGGAAAAPEGEIRPCTGSTASSGTATVNPDFSAAVASTDRYQLWAFMHPQKVLDTLDQVMKQDAYLPEWTILTEVPDGDMEQNNVTDWTASNATVTKVTAEPALWGKRWLSVVTTTAGGYAASNAMRVIPGKKYHLSALVRASAASTTPTLTAYDLTNSATISAKTTLHQSTVRLWMEFTAPATCYQVSIRLGNAENTVTSYWDEVCMFALDTKDLPLPWWVTNKGQVKGIFRTSWTSLGADVWDAMPVGVLDRERWNFRDSAFGRGQLRIVSSQGGVSGPMYVFGTRPETAWANENTETKHIDIDWLTARMMSILLRQMQGSLSIGLQHADWVAERQKYWDAEWKVERRKQEERLQDALQAQAPEVFVYSNDWANTASDWGNARLVN